MTFFLSSYCFAETDEKLRLGITTTTANSGLIEILNTAFTEQSGFEVQTVIAGSGQILRNAEAGDLDIVLVHSPDAEQAFVASGFGIERTLVMSNDFIVLGPSKDPVQVKNAPTIQQVMQKLHDSKYGFISRADDSGTHHKELSLWNDIDLKPKDEWYVESGLSMSKALLLANEKQLYILTDRATYLSLKQDIDLQILFSNPQTLRNPYHLILVNPEKLNSNYDLAKQYKDFLLSKKASEIVKNYTINQQALFNYETTYKIDKKEQSIIVEEKPKRSKHFFSSAVISAIKLISSLNKDLYDVVHVSLQTSLIAVLLASLLFMPIGIIIGLYEFKGKGLVLSLLNTAMALPTVIVGLLLYGLINRQGLLGDFGLLYTPIAMILGQCVLIAPIICNLSIIAVSSSDKRLLETCEALGANLRQKILIYISEARIALMAAVVTGFGRAIGEVGIAMMLGGNIAGFTRTMTTSIALETSKGEFEFALALGIVLLAVALIVNILLQRFQSNA